jgi:membrane protein implicated in regulation of membrane protease activity
MDTLFSWSAIVGGTILVVQTILTVIGIGLEDLDSDPGIDTELADATHHGIFGVLSFKALVAFATFFGLAGLAAHSSGLSPATSLGIAIAAGLASVWLVASLMRGLAKLQSHGNLDLENAVGKTAEVYIRIPGERTGVGRVHVNVQGRRVECKAMTRGAELTRGTQVRILDLHGDDVLIVGVAD